MKIPYRPEGEIIPEGVSYNGTEKALYFHFRKGDQIINVRVPQGEEPIEVISHGNH